MVLSQAPRQRVGDECRRRLMSMLSCAMASSAAPSAALAAATERPSALQWKMALSQALRQRVGDEFRRRLMLKY